jgi:hypothetical protein
MGFGTEYERAYLVGLRPIFDRGRSPRAGNNFPLIRGRESTGHGVQRRSTGVLEGC